MTAGTNWRDDAACLDADPDLFSRSGRPDPGWTRPTRPSGSAGPARCGNDAWRGRWSWVPPPASGEARPRTNGAPGAEWPPAITVAPSK
jgi:hypothetical protein